jgi:hypothetical protein
MLFDHLDERNAMVKFVPYFDNFTKWTFLSVNNNTVEKSIDVAPHICSMREDNHNKI